MNALDRLYAKHQGLPTTQAPVVVQPPPAKVIDPVWQQASALSRMMEIQHKNTPESQFAEIHRICGLPIIRPLDEEELEEFNYNNILAEAYNSGWRLWPTQANSVAHYEAYGGLFAEVGVGWGKTLITLMAANKAYCAGLKKIVLFVPSNVLFQLETVSIRWARCRVPISYPIHIMGGRSAADRRSIASSGKKGLYILTYSGLSTKGAMEDLSLVRPELIILDEAHKVSQRSAARTRRLLSYVEDHKPQIAALSGTITKKSIKDYYHLIRPALSKNNPLPNSVSMAHDWAALLDSDAPDTYGGTGINANEAGPLLPLVQWARTHYPQQVITTDISGFRRAYKLRKETCPGVVSTGDAELGTSLVISNQPVIDHEKSPGWSALAEMIDKIDTLWQTPNGDEIEHAIHAYKWLYELNSGFYNEMIWPLPDAYAQRKKITVDRAAEHLERSQIHHKAGQAYASSLRRDWLQHERSDGTGLDTPMLVGNDMTQHGDKNVPSELYQLWKQWKDLDFPERPNRDSRAVRVCPFKIDEMVKWHQNVMPKGRGAIIWVHHIEVGEWAYDALKLAGIDVLHCPAGKKLDDLITSIGDPDRGGKGDRTVVASITAHGEGKNLQSFQHQYFLQWPRPATTAEQTIGRTHRNGQMADELVVWTNTTLTFDEVNFAACLNDACYIHQTTTRQKLIFANYNPMPRIFPSIVLRERGMQNEMLTRDQERFLKEKFTKEG